MINKFEKNIWTSGKTRGSKKEQTTCYKFYIRSFQIVIAKMFSGLQAYEALGSYPEGNQRTAAFLPNQGVMDYQLGNYKSSPMENGLNANFVSQNGSDYQTSECSANVSVMLQRNTSNEIDLSTSNFESASAGEGSCSFRRADRNFPSYEELCSFWVQWKDRVGKCHSGMESIKFEEK